MKNIRLSQNPWIVCFPASLFFFYEFIQMTILNTLAPSIMKTFSIDALFLANLSSCYFYTNLLLLIPAGLLLDRFSVKGLLIAFMSISVAGTIVFSFASSLFIAEFGRLLSGIGGSIVFIGGIKLISRWFPQIKLPFVIALFTTIGYLGGMVGQTPFVIISDHYGWRTSLRILSAVGIVILVLIYLFVENAPDNKKIFSEKPIQLLTAFASLKLASQNIYTWLGGLYTMFMNLPIIILASLWSGLYLEETSHLSSMTASFVTSALLLGVMIGSIIVGWISSQFKTKKVIMILGPLLSLIIIFAIIFLGHLQLTMLLLLFFCLGFFSSAQCLGYPVIIENNNLKVTAIACGIGSMLVLGGGASLKILFGVILDSTWSGVLQNGVRIYSLYGFRWALSILPIGFLLSLIIAILTKDARREKLT